MQGTCIASADARSPRPSAWHRRFARRDGELHYAAAARTHREFRDLERRGVDRVAAEVSQEISMLFEDHDFHPDAGEKVAEHHAGRPSADDTAPDVHLFAWKSPLPHRWIPSGAIMSA